MRSLLLFLLLLPSLLPAQQLTNVQFRQEGQAVIVSYDLIPQHADDRFEVALFVSLNGGGMYLGPLSQVRGHSGPDQAGGYLRQIRWEAVAELGQVAAAQARFKVQATQTRAGGSRPTDLLPLPTMIRIPGGTFQMGSTEGSSDEKPVHTVTVSDFYLAETEVTFTQYDAFCEATGRDKPSDSGWGRGQRPVINVDWYDCIEYCNWLSEQQSLQPVYTIDKRSQDPNNSSGFDEKKWRVTANWQANGYRLPTEAEWEYAARALNGQGGGKVRFGNGQDIADPNQINFDASASYKKPYSRAGIYRQKTLPVGSFVPNSLGLYDMSGNVWEWCWDWYGNDYYASSPSRDPRGPDSGADRVLRGGSWSGFPRSALVAYRNRGMLSYRNANYGFRPARTP